MRIFAYVGSLLVAVGVLAMVVWTASLVWWLPVLLVASWIVVLTTAWAAMRPDEGGKHAPGPGKPPSLPRRAKITRYPGPRGPR